MADSTAGLSGDVVIVHAKDGQEWASFIQTKLTDTYNMDTRVFDFKKVSLHQFEYFKVTVVLISSDFLEGCAHGRPAWDFGQFDLSSTVMVLLGLNPFEVRYMYPEMSEHIYRCHHQIINQEDPSGTLQGALVEIIQVYERDESMADFDPFEEDIYQVPKPPVQINQVFTVIPPPASSSSSDAYVLLDRRAEDDVKVEVNTSTNTHLLKTKFLDKAAYSFKLPGDSRGAISLKVTCKDQVLGCDKLSRGESNLDHLRGLLEEVTNPVRLMCQALGLESNLNASLDDALSKQIQKQWTSGNQQLLTMLEMSVTGESRNSLYPTILHFAAEYNLMKTCRELSHCSRTFMAAACCTANVEGEFPCLIAQRKGYMDLAEFLVIDCNVNTDSGIVESLPPPKPHMTALNYINIPSNVTDSTDYMDMGELYTGNKPRPCKPTGGKPRCRSDSDAHHISFVNTIESSSSSSGEGSPPSAISTRPKSQGSVENITSSPEPLDDVIRSIKNSSREKLFKPHGAKPHTLPKPAVCAKPKPKPKPDASSVADAPRNIKPAMSSSASSKSLLQSSPVSSSLQQEVKEHVPLSQASSSHQIRDKDNGSDSEDYMSMHPATEKDLITDEGLVPTESKCEDVDNQDKSASVESPKQTSEDLPEEEKFPDLQDDQDRQRNVIGESYTLPEPALRGKRGRSKIASFVRRLIQKKQPSEPDLHQSSKSVNPKKTRVYSRQGRGSDPGLQGTSLYQFTKTGGKTYPRKMSLPAVHEKGPGCDSGSFSDDEEEGSMDAEKMTYRKSGKHTGHKRRSLERKKSVRLSRALSEKISNTPTVPHQPDRQGFQ